MDDTWNTIYMPLYDTVSGRGSIALYTLSGHGLRIAGECQPRTMTSRNYNSVNKTSMQVPLWISCSIMPAPPDRYNTMLGNT